MLDSKLIFSFYLLDKLSSDFTEREMSDNSLPATQVCIFFKIMYFQIHSSKIKKELICILRQWVPGH